ncbi:glycosyltransferase [Acinetobacter boissieri]|uniref:Glycosyltransferase involved in cell wall bisynthesis n=1 Tax=Acinetobacter boissieri TaxID=1219383 RepID=A0A1G6J4G6_9GAMM|nr:glycosyltransferase [Acinetobacter boissieri]SDC13509.1 Glycosyltransferase involved in cell wall bisynthesis [Acinetobacter boissieri]
MPKYSICLNMIVKNEANIIVDTLNNIRSYINIDYVVICDTGSTDATIAVIEHYLTQHQLAGEVHSHTWVDFAHNRNLALAQCEGKADYILVFDADDRFHGQFKLPDMLSEDVYKFQFKSDAREFFYTRQLLFKNNDCLHWVGVLHESLVEKETVTRCLLSGDYYVQTGHFGARSQDPNKYLKDALLLQQAYETEQDAMLKARYAYYCATSYYSYGDTEQAKVWFNLRINMGSTLENKMETYLACRHLGTLYQQDKQFELATFIWLKGASICPKYLEYLYEVSLLYKSLGDIQIAYDMAMLAKYRQYHEGGTALEPNIINYGLDYQMLTLALPLGRQNEAYVAWKRLLEQPFFSEQLNSELLAYQSDFTELMLQEDPSIQQQIEQSMQQLHATTPSRH